MSDRIELSESGVWSAAGFRKKRGRLIYEDRRFRLNICLDDRTPFEYSTIKTLTQASGFSDESKSYYCLKDCYIGGYQTQLGGALIRTQLCIIAYTKLHSKQPIKSLSYKCVEFDIPIHIPFEANLIDLLINKSVTMHEYPLRVLPIFQNGRFEATLKAVVSRSGGPNKVVMTTHSLARLKYFKSASIKTILKDIDLLRTVFAVCSQFEVAVNIDNVRLYYDDKGTHRSYESVTLTSMNCRKLQKYDGDSNSGNMMLFNTFLSKPGDIVNRYVNLLKRKDFQMVINSYLSHYIPSRRNGYTVELQFMMGIQLLEAVYERLVENSDDEIIRKKESFSCRCGNHFCNQCTKLQLRSLETKIAKLREMAFSQNSKYKNMSLPCGKISKTRNYLTHGKVNDNDILDVHEIDVLTCKMELIFLTIVYKELGYKEDELEKHLAMIEPFSDFSPELIR